MAQAEVSATTPLTRFAEVGGEPLMIVPVIPSPVTCMASRRRSSGRFAVIRRTRGMAHPTECHHRHQEGGSVGYTLVPAEESEAGRRLGPRAVVGRVGSPAA